ncbi:hypothetical protein B0J11DRAFT_7264 [Dendryphion nanum]|uniref:Anaphase-promoting complex subunit 2 n=1 Tax=Dendryphion nanum TaxID=256645 RepID=A0A9P9J0Y0_9PLEO|nr:hypothetical protein B0J11DRAFT_7264 [Dendryphion nanum]
MDHRTLVFASVFPVPSLSHTTPTPIATPDLGHTAPGQSFGGVFGGNTGGQHRAVKRNLAWSTATRFLSLPKPTNGANAILGLNATFDAQKTRRGAGIDEALIYLLVGEGKSEDAQEEDLLEWYTNEARLHFASFARPTLVDLWKQEIELEQAWEILTETQKLFQQVQDLYLQPFNDHILSILHRFAQSTTRAATRSTHAIEQSTVEKTNWKFRRDIHAILAYSLPPQQYSKTLSFVLYDAGCKFFSMYLRQDGIQTTSSGSSTTIRKRMTSLLQGLERVGVGGDFAQKAYAHAMDRLLDSFITSHYLKVDWYAKKSIVPNLRLFIKDGFAPLVELVLACLRCNTNIEPAELQSWQDMALSRLGKARVETLFDFVINWDTSLGAILDIKEYLKVNGGKQQLTSSFSQQVSRRLLHAGATTTYILNVYISIIRAFHELEPKGVLLERVARPIRRYLKDRDDTGRIIISSLLTDISDENGNKFASGSELSYEIASEMQKPLSNFNQDADEELNYNDMNWQPLPTDASPEYKKSKVEDVIWFLFTLWDREDFITELKNIMGEHLLKCQDPDYEKEIRLLELIKVRLGDGQLQACEVMLRDVLESKRINGTIQASGIAPRTPSNRPPETPENKVSRSLRNRQPTGPSPSLHPPSTPKSKRTEATTLNAQIISSFFWPSLRDDHFLVPTEIQELQKVYESRFERIKGMRKLRWMNALGDGTITLELEDRTEEFTGLMPWQVSVIYAFQPQPGEEWAGKGKGKAKKGNDGAVTRNVEQLEEMLEMDEALIRQSLAFWVGKAVLRETQPDTFTVIENSNSESVDSDAAAAAQELAEVQAQGQGAVRSQANLLAEKKDVYCSFVIGMLTNQGNMPTQRILMMLKMMAGFTFGMEELTYLLADMEKSGRVMALGGDVWGIKK